MFLGLTYLNKHCMKVMERGPSLKEDHFADERLVSVRFPRKCAEELNGSRVHLETVRLEFPYWRFGTNLSEWVRGCRSQIAICLETEVFSSFRSPLFHL